MKALVFTHPRERKNISTPRSVLSNPLGRSLDRGVHWSLAEGWETGSACPDTPTFGRGLGATPRAGLWRPANSLARKASLRADPPFRRGRERSFGLCPPPQLPALHVIH